MKTKLTLLLICILLCFPSCAQGEEQSTEADTTVLYNGSTAYVSDMEYGLDAAELYYVWRQDGTPDIHEGAIPYENGTDFLFEVTPAAVSLAEGCEEIELKLVQRPENTEVTWWSHLVNLDKQENGTWVRQAILDIETYRQSTFEWAMAEERYAEVEFYGNLTYDNTLGNRSIKVRTADIYPALSPGQYRLLFYLAVGTEQGNEYRQYAIPFTVTE